MRQPCDFLEFYGKILARKVPVRGYNDGAVAVEEYHSVWQRRCNGAVCRRCGVEYESVRASHEARDVSVGSYVAVIGYDKGVCAVGGSGDRQDRYAAVGAFYSAGEQCGLIGQYGYRPRLNGSHEAVEEPYAAVAAYVGVAVVWQVLAEHFGDKAVGEGGMDSEPQAVLPAAESVQKSLHRRASTKMASASSR